MKEVWRCQRETIPSDGEHVEDFPTLAAAKQAMREKISQCVDLREYLPDLDPNATKYLASFLSNPEFPRSEEDVPEDYEEPEHGELSLDSDWILWEYPCDAYPYLRTDLVTTKQNGDSYEFEFRYNYPEEYNGNGVTELSIKMELKTDYRTSAYPLMVLFTLREEPATQKQIARRIRETWELLLTAKRLVAICSCCRIWDSRFSMARMAIIVTGNRAPKKLTSNTVPVSTPLLILLVLDGVPKTKTAIIQAVHEKYGAKIDCKAVGRHLELLEAMDCPIKSDQKGYYITKKGMF